MNGRHWFTPRIAFKFFIFVIRVFTCSVFSGKTVQFSVAIYKIIKIELCEWNIWCYFSKTLYFWHRKVFCNSSKFSFPRPVGGIFVYISKIQNFYYIGNHFVGTFLTFPDNPYLRLPPKGDIADIGKFCHKVRGIVIILTNLFVLPGFLSKSRIHYHNVNLLPKVNSGIKKVFQSL